METNLQDRVVVVTGASGGIGSAICHKFAAEGARLILHYHKGRDRVLALQRELPADRCLVVRADLSKEAEATSLIRKAADAFGRIDTLVANAGAWETKDVPLHRMSMAQWRQTMDGVLETTFITVREYLRLVQRQRRGNAGHADYSAAKAAIAYGLTHSLKNEIAR